MNEVFHLTYSSSLTALCEGNSSFDTGVLEIAYHGKNRNGSSISKEVFEKCAETMYNCPIVCNYDRDTDSIGGHDMGFKYDDDGNIKLINMTTPVGVIPESSKYFWKTVTEEDGTEKEYLCADVLIWKRQEAYEKIKKDGITGHSMEITVKDGRKVDGVYVIDDFEFTAFCLLGEDHEPCFESSSLEMFSLRDIKTQMEQMMSELKMYEATNLSDGGLHNNNHTEGGNVLDEKIALINEYGLDVEYIEFEFEGLSIEELRQRLDAIVEKPKFELTRQIGEEIRRAVSDERVERPWGCEPRYCVFDFDVENMMVYCFDAKEQMRLYGFTFSMDGDSVVVDFESKKRMKIAVVEFNEGDADQHIADVFENAEKCFSENNTSWSEKYQAASDTIESMTDELESLRSFKAEADAAAYAAARDEIFAQFEDLSGVEEFEVLRNYEGELDLDTLAEKCYAIRGRQAAPAKFTKEQKQPKLIVEKRPIEGDEYGGLFTKYRPRV